MHVVGNRLKMGLDVQAPRMLPASKFGLQLLPLLVHARDVFALMMKQQGRRLDETLNQQNLFLVGMSDFQSIPQGLPSFVGMPELTVVKQRQPFIEQLGLFIGQFTCMKGHGSAVMVEP